MGQQAHMPKDPDDPKIYFLPNLMTAGNLCCGFFAVLMIHKGILEATQGGGGYSFLIAQQYYEKAILLIFGSCLFDLLDGRLARLGGQDSPFGREFDSLADVVAFGMAPSMLMAKAVLFELPVGVGWVLACLYVVCGAIRLARFNCLAALPKKPNDSNDFRGIPIPMAAGFIASLTFLLMHVYQGDGDHELGVWKYILAAAMFGLSILMVSNVRYPSFKKVGWKTKANLPALIIAVLVIILTVQFYHVMPVVLFSIYLLYGLCRPLLAKSWRREIESVVEENTDDAEDEVPADDHGRGGERF